MTRVRTDQFSETMIVRARGRLLARALLVLLVAVILAQFARVAFGRDAGPAEGPDFVLKSTAGANVRLSEYRSEVVALAFWAAWCGDCRDGLPVLERLQADLGPDGLRVLAVSFDDDPAAAREAARAAGVSFPVLVDPAGEVGRLYDVDDLPLVVLLDRAGKVRHSFDGKRAASDPALAAQARALLAE